MNNPNETSYTSVLRMLDVLLSSEMGAAEKRQILQDEFGIPMTRTMEKGVSEMCNLSQGVLEKGKAKERMENIRSLMETMGLTIEQAMTALKVPEDERQRYKVLLEQ